MEPVLDIAFAWLNGQHCGVDVPNPASISGALGRESSTPRGSEGWSVLRGTLLGSVGALDMPSAEPHDGFTRSVV